MLWVQGKFTPGVSFSKSVPSVRVRSLLCQLCLLQHLEWPDKRSNLSRATKLSQDPAELPTEPQGGGEGILGDQRNETRYQQAMQASRVMHDCAV